MILTWYQFVHILVVLSLGMALPTTKLNIKMEHKPEPAALAGPAIHDITVNQSIVPRYEKFEITFQVDTSAANLQMPYDASAPAGIPAGWGVSVDGLFSPDGWVTTYRQPAFYYQDFDSQLKDGQSWFYPTNNTSWKVRFAPDRTGIWQFKLAAEDSSGRYESPIQSFTVTESTSRGFVRVSQTDHRYFEYSDGSYFPGLGYNMNYNHVGWINPVEGNRQNFEIMGQNGIQLVRVWLSQWSIYGSAWNPWNAIDPALNSRYIPYEGLTTEVTNTGSDASMRINAARPCMFLGWGQARPAVKRNTDYRVRILYQTRDIAGPRVAGQPYGLVAKTGGWLWGSGTNCMDSGTGTTVTPYQAGGTSGWQVLEGQWNSGGNDFLPYFYLVMENISQGAAWIDKVWIEEDLGGSYGPNILSKPWMSQDLYMEQRNSYAFDQMLELAEQTGIYLRLVIHEKNEFLGQRFDFEGNRIPDDPLCSDADPGNNPVKCPGNTWFYGNNRQMTRTRWLQQAWWRYLQARWGYSTHIHSWELLNEGDPASTQHYTMADEFGRYMHQFTPNDHMVSTSFWHSFPSDAFWANPEYSSVDFADVHQYVNESSAEFEDTAQITYDLSMQRGANQPGGAGKPVLRGETGFIVTGTETGTALFDADLTGVWLHNFIWGGINPGGLIESYWYENFHIYRQRANGSYIFDHRNEYGAYANFIRDIPLNNGHYQDAAAQVSQSGLRAWGQKDLVNGRAHLWIQNTGHTWQAAANGTVPPPLSGSITLSGFLPDQAYRVEWWNPYPASGGASQVIRIEYVNTDSSGRLELSVSGLQTDVAVKVFLSSGDGIGTYVTYLPSIFNP